MVWGEAETSNPDFENIKNMSGLASPFSWQSVTFGFLAILGSSAYLGSGSLASPKMGEGSLPSGMPTQKQKPKLLGFALAPFRGPTIIALFIINDKIM